MAEGFEREIFVIQDDAKRCRERPARERESAPHKMMSQVPETERQRRLLEDELGRPLHALRDDEHAETDEKFRRDVFKYFECARRLLSSTSLREYITSRGEETITLVLSDNLTLKEVMTELQKYEISSAPVMRDNFFVGWVTALDFLSLLMSLMSEIKPIPKQLASETAKLCGAPHVHSVWGVLRKAVPSVTSSERLVGTDVDDRVVALDNARREYVDSISAEDVDEACRRTLAKTLAEARKHTHSQEDGRMINRVKASDADMLDLVRSGMLRAIVSPGSDVSPRKAKPCHRVCLYSVKIHEQDGKEKMYIEDMISQTDVVEFLYANIDKLEETQRYSLASLGLGARKKHRVFPDSDVVCAYPTERLFDCFFRMYVAGLSALGIIDEPRGQLIGTLTLNDLAAIVTKKWAPVSLHDTVETYLSKAPKRKLITVHEDSDFGDVLRALVFGGVHHVFVLDLEGSPLLVLTPTDILQRIALPSAQKIGWRFDSYEIHPDSFRDRAVSV